MAPIVFSRIPDETHCPECAEGDGCTVAQRAWAEEKAAYQAWLDEQVEMSGAAPDARTDPDSDDLPFD